MPPLLTVGVPVYNGMPFVKETMESLFNQTFKGFNILVINDGSRDDSLEYLRSLKDPRLKLISQENRGLTATLNRMLANIDTPWLVRQDADDISLPDRMGTLNSWAMRHPEAGLLYSDASHYQNDRLLVELQTTFGSPEELRRLTRAGHLLSICHSAIAINARKLMDIGGYRFDLYVEDYDMYWRMALATDLLHIPRILVGARIGTRGISGKNIEKQALNMLWIQYLLMSSNRGLMPLDYPEAARRLEALLHPGVIQYRLHMRQCLDSVYERSLLNASAHLLRAAISSPDMFARRVLKLLRADKNIVLGIDPAIIRRRTNDLWPGAVAAASPALDMAECAVGESVHH